MRVCNDGHSHSHSHHSSQYHVSQITVKINNACTIDLSDTTNTVIHTRGTLAVSSYSVYCMKLDPRNEKMGEHGVVTAICDYCDCDCTCLHALHVHMIEKEVEAFQNF